MPGNAWDFVIAMLLPSCGFGFQYIASKAFFFSAPQKRDGAQDDDIIMNSNDGRREQRL